MKEKRSSRMNLSLTPAQYNDVCNAAKKANLKPIIYATHAVLGKKIITSDTNILIDMLLSVYRKQVGFSKLVLRDCDNTDEVKRIANATINDFREKIEKLEKTRSADENRNSN